MQFYNARPIVSPKPFQIIMATLSNLCTYYSNNYYVIEEENITKQHFVISYSHWQKKKHTYEDIGDFLTHNPCVKHGDKCSMHL